MRGLNLMCKNCIFSEIKNSEYVFCKNLERCIENTERCKKFIQNNILIKRL